MRLAHELVHLRVRGEMDDEVDLRVLDAADAAAERRVVAGEVLEQRREGVGPRVLALVDAEHVVPVGEQAQAEVRADLARGAGDQDAHAATMTGVCDGLCFDAAKRRRRGVLDQHVDEVAGRRRAGEVDGRVAARSAAEQRSDRCATAPSTSTSSTRPMRAWFRSRAIFWIVSTSRSMRSIFTSCGT